MGEIIESMEQERKELLGTLVDVVEDWLEDRGFIPADFRIVTSQESEEGIIIGDDYDRLADGFAKVIEKEPEGDMWNWAKNEVKLACKEKPSHETDGEWDYDCACYESALKAYKSLLEDQHSGSSIRITHSILNRLIKGMPLTPIEDTEDTWNYAHDGYEDATKIKVYHSRRQSSLFKYVYPDGKVKYNDIDRVLKMTKILDSDYDGETLWHSKLTDDIVNEMFPITMPYVPEEKNYKVHCEEFLYDKETNGDFDTVGVLYMIKPDGTRIVINRFFKDDNNSTKEIDENEYRARKEEILRSKKPAESFVSH